MTLDEIEIRDVEVMIAVTNRAGTEEGLDEIVFPTIGWQGYNGSVVTAGTDAQDIAQRAQGGLAKKVDEEGVADGLVGLKEGLSAAEHDEHVNGDIRAGAFKCGEEGSESEGVADAGEAHADDGTARSERRRHGRGGGEEVGVIWAWAGGLASSGRCRRGGGL